MQRINEDDEDSSSDGDSSLFSLNEGVDYINSRIIHDYFAKCGRIVELKEVENMMDEVEATFSIEGFNGRADTKINFSMFL